MSTYTHGQIVEYGTVTSDQFSKVTKLETGINGRREYTLNHHTPGFECAGSMARYNGREVWSVQFYMDGATHGRRFLAEADARALFQKWTNPAEE